MDCYAWDIPVGCYEAARDTAGASCQIPWWFWLAVAGAAIMASSGGRKRKPAKAAGARARRKR